MFSFLKNFKWLNSLYEELSILFTRFDEHHIFLIAAGIAFNILLYMIPLFLLAIYIINQIFDINIISQTIERVLLEILPPTTTVHNLVKEIINELNFISTHSTLAGWIGIIILLWLSSALFSSLRTGLNRIYYISSPHIFILYRIKDMLFTIMLTLLLLVSYYLFPFISIFSNILGEKLPDVLGSFFSSFTIFISSSVSSFLFFYFIFRFIPNQKIPPLPRFISTVLSVAFIEISRYIFAWYISSISNLGRFYGTYAVIVSLALWIYYFSLIILVSAEFGQFIYEAIMKRKLISSHNNKNDYINSNNNASNENLNMHH
jgi:YihY family inner membrane protein